MNTKDSRRAFAAEQDAIDNLVESIKADIEAKLLRSCCNSFADLHDHCDANCLGNSEEFFDSFGDDVEAATEALNEAQNRVSAWLAS